MLHCWSFKHVCTSFLLFLTNERCNCCCPKRLCVPCIIYNKRTTNRCCLKHVCVSLVLFLTNECCHCCSQKHVCVSLVLFLTNEWCHCCSLKHVCVPCIISNKQMMPLLQPKTRVCVPCISSKELWLCCSPKHVCASLLSVLTNDGSVAAQYECVRTALLLFRTKERYTTVAAQNTCVRSLNYF